MERKVWVCVFGISTGSQHTDWTEGLSAPAQRLHSNSGPFFDPTDALPTVHPLYLLPGQGQLPLSSSRTLSAPVAPRTTSSSPPLLSPVGFTFHVPLRAFDHFCLHFHSSRWCFSVLTKRFAPIGQERDIPWSLGPVLSGHLAQCFPYRGAHQAHPGPLQAFIF